MSAELAAKIQQRVGGSAEIMIRLDANYRLHHAPVKIKQEQGFYLQAFSY
ncbi:hypothetical protein G6R29_03165 [Fructobacillus sp. M2-14]|uniref:Uncharacterized protein n=1 Tax=Fructobacillus broussonetiae TaxID=2713173 RepID=A0ABS5QZJ4_9LACO|nr:hypothetical protein [Fructobacillus broussonetiae]MBS9338633.1 hypothetical protein [Fructobacillus broussonetiae]